MKILMYILNSFFGIVFLTGGATYFLSFITSNPKSFWIVYIFSFVGLVSGFYFAKKRPSYKWTVLLFVLATIGFAVGELGISRINFN
jgi:hypothetical protein